MKYNDPYVQAIVIKNKVFVPSRCTYEKGTKQSISFWKSLNGFVSIDLKYFICVPTNKKEEDLLNKLKLKPCKLIKTERKQRTFNLKHFSYYEPNWEKVQKPMGTT